MSRLVYSAVELVSEDDGSVVVVFDLVGAVELDEARYDSLHLLEIPANLKGYHLLSNDVQLQLGFLQFLFVLVVELGVLDHFFFLLGFFSQILNRFFVQRVLFHEDLLWIHLRYSLLTFALRSRCLVEGLGEKVVRREASASLSRHVRMSTRLFFTFLLVHLVHVGFSALATHTKVHLVGHFF